MAYGEPAKPFTTSGWFTEILKAVKSDKPACLIIPVSHKWVIPIRFNSERALGLMSANLPTPFSAMVPCGLTGVFYSRTSEPAIGKLLFFRQAYFWSNWLIGVQVKATGLQLMGQFIFIEEIFGFGWLLHSIA